MSDKSIRLQQYQIVNYKSIEFEKIKSNDLSNLKNILNYKIEIESTYFRAILAEEDDIFRIIIIEFEKEIYILESPKKLFKEIETGVIMFQLIANIGKNTADFNFDTIHCQSKVKGDIGFWFDKFVTLSLFYNQNHALLFDSILESIIKLLQSNFQEKFKLNKLLSKVVLKIKDKCSEHEYTPITFFISCWQEKYPDFFRYSELSKLLYPDIQLKTELWVLELYSFEELFIDKNQITNEAIDYAINQDEDWLHNFLLKLKSIEAPTEQIQKLLFKFISKELPENFENLKKELEFVCTNFPELKTTYLEELKKNRTSKEQIILWENEFIELPLIKALKDVFNEVSDETKIKIINAVPASDKISLLNSSIQSGLKIPAYYRNIFKVIKGIINDFNIFVFDLEYDGHNIKELAFSQSSKVANATSLNEIEKLLPQFKETLNNPNSFLAGHNIEKFDIPLLKEKIELPNDIGVVDTLLLETLLSPTFKSFALDTKHNAKDDVEHTLNLLTNQVIRLIHISESQLKKFEYFIDANFLKLLYELRENVSDNTTELYSHFETERNKYFVKKQSGSKKSIEFENFLIEKTTEPTFIIAPNVFYPLLAELSNIEFNGDGSEYSKIISKKRLRVCLKAVWRNIFGIVY
ncbi:MAG: hypothetical protein IPN14_08560 [Bacteroidetes bacterium]|nr:hypothetical protein [Bacteroidota bacterium]